MTRRSAITSSLAMLWFPVMATSAEPSKRDWGSEATVNEGPLLDGGADQTVDETPPESASESSEAVDAPSGPIVVTLRLLPDRPVSGTGYEFQIAATNVSADEVILEFRNGQVFDLWIIGNGSQLIWRWASGRMFTQALRQVWLLPGETSTRQVVWPGTDASGTIQVTGPLIARADWVSRPGGSSRPLAFIAE